MLSPTVKGPSQGHLINSFDEDVANPTFKKVFIVAFGISAGVASSFMKANPLSGFGGAIVGGMLGLGAASSIQVEKFNPVTHSVSVSPSVKKISIVACGVLAGMASSFLEANPLSGFGGAIVGGMLGLGVASFLQGSESVSVPVEVKVSTGAQSTILENSNVVVERLSRLDSEREVIDFSAPDEVSESGDTHYDTEDEGDFSVQPNPGSPRDSLSVDGDEDELNAANLLNVVVELNPGLNPLASQDSLNHSVHSDDNDEVVVFERKATPPSEKIKQANPEEEINEDDHADEGTPLLTRRKSSLERKMSERASAAANRFYQDGKGIIKSLSASNPFGRWT